MRSTHLLSSAVREILDAPPTEEVTDEPLNARQIKLLRYLLRTGPCRLGAVSAFLGVSPPAAIRTIDKLERLSLAFRAPHPGDRRGKVLALAPGGRRAVQRYEAGMAARIDRLLEAVEAAELDRLSSTAEEVAVELFRQERPRPGPCLRCGDHLEADCPVGEMVGGCPYGDSRSGGTARREGRGPARTTGRGRRRLGPPGDLQTRSKR